VTIGVTWKNFIMSTNKLDTVTLQTILPRLELSKAATVCLDRCERPSEAVSRLVQADLLIEAARVCAHALPSRERVWWAARCVRATATGVLPAADGEATALAEGWVRRPADETRRAAMEKAQATGFTSPEAWVAVAAFWSGDSMAPPDQPKVPPAPHLAGSAVVGAVILASVRTYPDRQPDRLRRFVCSALDIAAGGAGHLEQEAA
jgi:hypothetical protein